MIKRYYFWDRFKHYVNIHTKKIEICFIMTLLTSVLLMPGYIVEEYSNKVFVAFTPLLETSDAIFLRLNKLVVKFLSLVNQEKETIKLRLELEKYKNLLYEIEFLRIENNILRKELRLAPNKSNFTYIAAKLVGLVTTPFTSSIEITAGTNHGVAIGQPVVFNNQFLGYIKYVNKNYSIVRLINDVYSRIPVISNNSREKAILAGTSSNLIKILHLDDENKIKEGELLFAYLDGEYSSLDLAVAKVSTKDENGIVYAVPIIDIKKVEFVNIIKPLN